MEEFNVRRAVNGGWIVTNDIGRLGMMGNTMGAFSNTEDLLDWLSEKLLPPPEIKLGPSENVPE